MLSGGGSKRHSIGFSRPLLHVGTHDEVRLARDAEPLRRERHVEASVVDVNRSVDPDLALAALAVAKRPDVAVRRVLVREAGVPGQVPGLQRLAVASEIRGCGAADEARRADPAAHKILAARLADAHGEIEAFLDEIDHALGELDVEAHLQVARGERGDRRREMACAEGRRAGETKRAARHDRRGRDRDLGLLEIREELHAALEERLPAFREREPPRRPVEQARVEMRLEVGDEARHRRDGDAQALGRAREAAGLDDAGESGQCVEAVHEGGAHCCIISNSISFLLMFILLQTTSMLRSVAPPEAPTEPKEST